LGGAVELEGPAAAVASGDEVADLVADGFLDGALVAARFPKVLAHQLLAPEVWGAWPADGVSEMSDRPLLETADAAGEAGQMVSVSDPVSFLEDWEGKLSLGDILTVGDSDSVCRMLMDLECVRRQYRADGVQSIYEDIWTV
jgi:hypothetical protein